MKKLIYKIEGYTSVYNPETCEVEQRLSPSEVVMYDPTDADIARVAEISYNGEYAVEDDGQPEHESEVTTDDILNAMLGVM